MNHDGSGNLSGYAWGGNVGWINFNPSDSQVTIVTGDFDWYAWGENVGWIHFKNTSPAYNVVTSWSSAPVVVTPIPDQTVNENSPDTVIDLLPHFTDLEDGAAGLAYSVQANTNAGLFISVTVAGSMLTLDYAPDVFGTADITIRAADSGGLFADDTFTMTVSEAVAPTPTPTPPPTPTPTPPPTPEITSWSVLWNNDDGTRCAIVYLNADGSIDTTQGAGGFAFFDFGLDGWTSTSIHTNSDGTFRILWNEDRGTRCCIWYMNADGSFDTSMGSNGITYFDSGLYGWTAASIHLQADLSGRILWNEDAGTLCCIWYLKADGTINTTKGSGGFSFIDSGVYGWTATSFHLRADGTGMVLWNEDDLTRCCIWYINADGTIDATKGSGGFRFFDSGLYGWSANDLFINPDDSHQFFWNEDGGTQGCIWYLNADGSLDTSEGTGGFGFVDSVAPGWTATSYGH